MEEEWKDIQGYEGIYKISNCGRIKSLLRFNNMSKDNTMRGYYRKEKILKPSANNSDYLYIFLCKNGKKTMKTIHRLVAETFIPNPNNYEQVNHIDGNKQNNRMDNLEWCTRKHNMQEAFRIGLVKRPRGAKHPLSMRVNQYDLSGNLIKEWGCLKEIERELNFGHSNISNCCKGRYKSAYGYIWKYVDERNNTVEN